MKILINAFSAKLGGGQTYIINLLSNIPDDFNAEILVFAPNSLDLPANKNIKRCDTKWPTNNPFIRLFWEKFVLPKILKKEGIDVLFNPGGTVNTSIPDTCLSVTMFRNMIPFDSRVRKSIPFGMQRFRNFLLERVMLKSMKNADLTIFISDYARQIIEKRIALKNAITIPHGINPLFRTQNLTLTAPEGLENVEYFLYVSRFDVYKHHLEVVKGYANLSDEIKNKYKLILIGETDNDLHLNTLQFIKDNNLSEKVLILGPKKYTSLPSYYKNASLILFASSCENCPNIMLESMGSGNPVISSNIMPMPEFGMDAVEYFSPYSPESITSAIKKVILDKHYSSQLALSAYQKSLEYEWTNTAKLTWNSLMQLVRENKPN